MRVLPFLTALILCPQAACAQGSPAGRLAIEGITLGMTEEQVAAGIGDGWVHSGQISNLHTWEFGTPNEPGFRRMRVTLGFMSGAGSTAAASEAVVRSVGLGLIPSLPATPPPSASEIQTTLDEVVGLYGPPDRCDPHATLGVDRACYWTRPVDQYLDETRTWGLSVANYPHLSLEYGTAPSPPTYDACSPALPPPTP